MNKTDCSMNQHTNDERIYARELTTAAVESALEKREYEKVSNLVELADKYGVNKALRFKAWKAVGSHWMSAGYFGDASIAFNSARHIYPMKTNTVKLMFECIHRFVREYEEIFSLSDLSSIEDELERILEFYKVNKLWNQPAINAGKQLLHDVVALKRTAIDAVETPATHKTNHIVDALHSNVSMDEVQADFARIITPYLLEQIAEEEKRDPKKKKKKQKAKNPEKVE
jgi:hypothetical protein